MFISGMKREMFLRCSYIIYKHLFTRRADESSEQVMWKPNTMLPSQSKHPRLRLHVRFESISMKYCTSSSSIISQNENEYDPLLCQSFHLHTHHPTCFTNNPSCFNAFLVSTFNINCLGFILSVKRFSLSRLMFHNVSNVISAFLGCHPIDLPHVDNEPL